MRENVEWELLFLGMDDCGVITYEQHLPYGSLDKLYEVIKGYQQIVNIENINCFIGQV